MDAPDFDQDVLYAGPGPDGPGPGEHQRALLIPHDVSIALREARLARSLSPAQEAASCHVPVTLVLGLEAGHTTEFVDEADLLTTVGRIATFLGFAPGTPASDILRAWSSAYAGYLGPDIQLPEPLDPTQPLPLVSQAGRSPGPLATGPLEISQGSTPRPRRSGPRSPLPPAEPLREPAKRRPPARRALLGAMCAAAILVVGVAATFGAREAGLLGTDQRHSDRSASSAGRTRHVKTSSPLLQSTSTGTAQATYAVGASSYELTLRSNRPSWVRVGTATGAPQFAGIVTPGAAERLMVGGPVQVQIGAGGTTVTVSAAGRSSATLTPPSAPYTYQLNPEPTGTRV